MGRTLAIAAALMLTQVGPSGGQVPDDVARAEELARIGFKVSEEACAMEAFGQAVALARDAVAAHPELAEAHYALSLALGGRMEHLGTRDKIGAAAEVKAEAERALELEPEHPGAHHILGRLNAAAMRMSGVKRFLARSLLGASALDGASWDNAEQHFLAARAAEPNNPRHAMELGALYLDTGRPEKALAVLTALLDSPRVDTDPDRVAVDRARTLLAQAAAEGN